MGQLQYSNLTPTLPKIIGEGVYGLTAMATGSMP